MKDKVPFHVANGAPSTEQFDQAFKADVVANMERDLAAFAAAGGTVTQVPFKTLKRSAVATG